MALSNNIELIFNCLGSSRDLRRAIEAQQRGENLVKIYRVYTTGQEREFVDRSFEDPERVGKAVYHYS